MCLNRWLGGIARHQGRADLAGLEGAFLRVDRADPARSASDKTGIFTAPGT
jgi:hypothetical protein